MLSKMRLKITVKNYKYSKNRKKQEFSLKNRKNRNFPRKQEKIGKIGILDALHICCKQWYSTYQPIWSMQPKRLLHGSFSVSQIICFILRLYKVCLAPSRSLADLNLRQQVTQNPHVYTHCVQSCTRVQSILSFILVLIGSFRFSSQ